jgi:SAM-dependent methyltransferase
MNYGLWDKNPSTLIEANMALIHRILKKTAIQNHGKSILDVGCGYGQQDIEWAKILDPSCKITAVDISESQIQNARKRCQDLSGTIRFEVCDAQEIDIKFQGHRFDVITSVESAFHYPDRPKFFKAAHSLLSADGTFVICDLMLKPDYVPTFASGLFLHIFSDFLAIPKANLINPAQWEQDIKASGFEILEFEDLTEKTFAPYYIHVFDVYTKTIGLPRVFNSTLNHVFKSVQPFSYRLAVCRPHGIRSTSSDLQNLSESRADSVSISISPPATE